ncbi:MAG TPA: hypothetical protein VNZ01_08610 [Solirubrobacteraceae bacterium]|jgi:hypothetical protein|nr:hypothetical protein [Solirubrobacteraceae bacterium]
MTRSRFTTFFAGAAAIPLTALLLSGAAIAASGTHGKKHSNSAGNSKPVTAVVITPGGGDVVASQFNVDVSLQAKNALGNTLLSEYKNQFIDPTGPDGKENPEFHPGASSAAPGLVVTLSTTPNKPGTPLVGPSTNLAGVFQENSVSKSHGRLQTWNDWEVSAPGFFGENTKAVLTVYAVAGKAPNAVPAGGLKPISNVVHETFRIG